MHAEPPTLPLKMENLPGRPGDRGRSVREAHFFYRTEVLMTRSFLICFAVVVICGCSGPTFTNLGNGIGVPTGSIEEYAESNGISRDEARQRMLEESNERKQNQNSN
jgi:hypothetical protein